MSDVVYFFLMALGWFFLVGWSVALLTACAIAFRQEIIAERLGHMQQGPTPVGARR
jgi:hypothetical protein